MKDLLIKYGKNKSFNDDDLFNDIEKFTYPQIGDFLRKHVGGKIPLPMAEILAKVGINYSKEIITSEFSFGGADLDYNPETKRLVITSISNMDEFGKSLGYKNGDELYKHNGKELKIEMVKEVIGTYYKTVKDNDKVVVEIYRPKRKAGKYKVKTLKAKAKKVKITRKNQITLSENITEKQKQT